MYRLTPTNPLRFAISRELLVGQVARVAAQNPRIAVRCNKRTVGCLAHILEAAVGQMRYINDYPLLAAVADQLLAQLGQTLVLIHGGCSSRSGCGNSTSA